MTPEEKAAHDLLLTEIKSLVADGLKESKSKLEKLESDSAEYKALKIRIDGIEAKKIDLKSVEEFKTLVEELNDTALKVKAIEEKGIDQKEKGATTMYKAIEAAFMEKKAELDEIVKGGQKAPFKVEVKAVGTISVASTIGAGATQVTITEDTGITSTIRKREILYYANVSVGRISTNRALWIEETDEEGTPIMLAEGATKNQLDVQYVEQTKAVKKIAVFGKVTTELMADLPQLISYIQNNLMKRMDIVLEDQLFSGNGVGDNLNGLIGYASAFTGSTLALNVDNANEYDVLVALALQSQVAFGKPNAVFVHPGSIAKMRLLKSTTGEYLIPRGTPDNMLEVAGMRVIGSTALAADAFVGGDLSVVNVLIREDMGIQIGLDGNDFTQNKKTMLMEKRLVQFVSANDTAVIIDGTFTAAKAALETP